MTTSRRSSRHIIGFQFVSEWSLRRPSWCGSVCRTQRQPLCASADGRRQSHSAVPEALLLPWTLTSTGQCFAAYGLGTWNRLPTALPSSELSLSSFKRQFKTHLSVPALAAAVGVVYRRPAQLWLHSEIGADYKCPHAERGLLQPFSIAGHFISTRATHH